MNTKTKPATIPEAVLLMCKTNQNILEFVYLIYYWTSWQSREFRIKIDDGNYA